MIGGNTIGGMRENRMEKLWWCSERTPRTQREQQVASATEKNVHVARRHGRRQAASINTSHHVGEQPVMRDYNATVLWHAAHAHTL